MSPAPDSEALSRAFNRAVADHFGGVTAKVDAEEVMVAAVTVTASYIAGVRDPVSRGVLLARAQWTLRSMVDEIARADAAEGRRGR